MQSLADSLNQIPEELVDDTSAIDSSGLGALNESVGQVGQLLSQGQLDEAVETFGEAVFDFAISNMLPALVVAFAFYLVYRLLNTLLLRALKRSKRVDAGVQQLITRALRIIIFSFAAITVFDQLGVNVTALVAGLGVAGIALGFAAKDTLENFIAGVTILLDRPFRIGDNIEISETFGTVTEIALRSTRIRTVNNEIAVLPNARVITERIINHTRLRNLRVCVPFGIAYKESPSEARNVVLAITEGDERLHAEYDPEVVVLELGDSSVNMELRLYLRDAKQEIAVRLDYQEKVFDALKAADIEIPFPHLQLFIDEAKAFQGTQMLKADEDKRNSSSEEQ